MRKSQSRFQVNQSHARLAEYKTYKCENEPRNFLLRPQHLFVLFLSHFT